MDYKDYILQLSDEQREENYGKLLSIIEKHITGERKSQLLELYSTETYKTRLLTAPAASIIYFHNAFAGGYCQHILNVVKASEGMYKFYKMMGGIIDFEYEEMIFAALHHDFGKLGDETGEYYLLCENEWDIKKFKKMFEVNSDLQYMEPADRALYVLQRNGIKYTFNEMLGIKLADGMYDDSNKPYLKQFAEKHQLKTNLPHIIHAADYMSMKVECDAAKKWLSENWKD